MLEVPLEKGMNVIRTDLLTHLEIYITLKLVHNGPLLQCEKIIRLS